MESKNSASCEPQEVVESVQDSRPDLSEQWFSERFESLLPRIQERWPNLAKQTLEATRGSLDELVRVISQDSGKTSQGVQEQLEDLFNTASDRTKDLADSLEPLEKQLEELLDELNTTLRPRIEKPVRQRPLVAIGIATGIGVLLGVLLAGGRRS
tara:strand:+ start:61 stop:525 length:465 start_codon:yes stop_codon:yes gene_type:complete